MALLQVNERSGENYSTSFSSLVCKVLHDRGNTIIRKKKLTKEASIGRKMVAVATLEVNSVNVVIMIQTHITIA